MKVMLVEDNPVTQESLEALLRATGYEVDHAGNGYGALTRLSVHKVDAIVADYLMPGMDGLTLAREVRKLPNGWGDAPVILITAVADEDLPLFELGSVKDVTLLRKPFDPGVLLNLLKNLGGKHGQEPLPA